MQNKQYQYLHTRKAELWWANCLLFVPYFSLFLVFKYSVLWASFWYWLICGTLFIAEYKRAYFLINDGVLTQKFVFSEKKISIHEISRIIRGKPFGLTHIGTIECLYMRGGVENAVTILLTKYDFREIEKFIQDLHETNSEIIIEEKVYKWIEKKKQQSLKKKTLSDYFYLE